MRDRTKPDIMHEIMIDMIPKSELEEFNIDDREALRKDIRQMTDLLNNIAEEKSSHTENLHLKCPIEKKIINILLALFSELLDWAKDKNKILYFEILVEYIDLRPITCEPTKLLYDISQKAKEKIMIEFESFAKKDLEGANAIIGLLLSKSDRLWYPTIHINQVLNKVFFLLEDIDIVGANNELYKVLKEERKYRSTHGGRHHWNPTYAAFTEYASSELLERLGKSTNAEIRLNVAYNPNTPSYILERLVDDEDRSVSCEAKNALEKIEKDK